MKKTVQDAGVAALLVAVAAAAGMVIHHVREKPQLAPTAAQSASKPGKERLPPVPLHAGAQSGTIMSVREFRTEWEEKRALVIDTRSVAEYRRAHVPGALSLPSGDFEAAYASLKPRLEGDKSRRIILYCSSFYCKTSEAVQEKLHQLGYSHVVIFINGWAAWQQADLPEEAPE